MTETEKALTLERIAAWKRAEPVLQQVRDADIRAADTMQSLHLLGGVMAHAVRSRPAPPTSGLVEQQAWFRKIAHAP